MIRPVCNRIQSMWRRATGHFKSRGMVLLYHRIARSDFDPWSLCVTPEHFSEHLEVLKTSGQVTTLARLVDKAHSRSWGHPAIAITFDDGYADNLDSAKPLLEQRGLPATFFITSGAMTPPQEFWWDELEKILLQPNSLPEVLHARLEGQCLHFELGKSAVLTKDDAVSLRTWRPFQGSPPTARHALYCILYERFRDLRPETREAWMTEIRQWAQVTIEPRSALRRLSANEIVQLGSHSLFEIGGHTVNHPSLRQLDRPTQLYEIQCNKKHLDEMTGRRTTSFAYPHGLYSPPTVEIVRACGFQHACTTMAAPVQSSANSFALPRVVVEDCDGEGFSRLLGHWLSA
jgi:peptidoglycan/xylan/chitin deacetylase (PgdA/CDA1 family)